MIYTLNDYKVLKNILDRNDDKKGLSKSTGTTVHEIVVKTELSDKKVRDSLKNFLNDEMIAYGVANGRTKTYYILPKGLEEIISLNEMVVKED